MNFNLQRTMKTTKQILMLFFAILVPAARAQLAIDWSAIAGGGGTSTGGVYSVSGAIGQPDAGAMSGGHYSLVGGFWSLFAAVPTPGAPRLTISLTTTNTVLITWPSSSPGFALQQNADLRTTNWMNAAQSPTDDGKTKRVVMPLAPGLQFFRLKR